MIFNSRYKSHLGAVMGIAIVSMLFLSFSVGATTAYADTSMGRQEPPVSLNWCVGPVYAFDDFEAVVNKVDLLEQYDLHPAVLVMPVYENTDTKTYQAFARVLRTFSQQGVPILIREPVVNLEGTYGKNRASALYDGLNVLMASQIQVGGIVLEKEHQQVPSIAELQSHLPIQLSTFYVAKEHMQDDWYEDVLSKKYEVLLVDAALQDSTLMSWLNRMSEGRLSVPLWPDAQDTLSYRNLIETWNENNQMSLNYHDRFILEEEAKIAGKNVAREGVQPVLDISKNVQLVSFVIAIMAIGLLIMFLINFSINRQKYFR